MRDPCLNRIYTVSGIGRRSQLGNMKSRANTMSNASPTGNQIFRQTCPLDPGHSRIYYDSIASRAAILGLETSIIRLEETANDIRSTRVAKAKLFAMV